MHEIKKKTTNHNVCPLPVTSFTVRKKDGSVHVAMPTIKNIYNVAPLVISSIIIVIANNA